MPKVSILLPIYKTKSSFLREAIDSILQQTFQDFELLILNDSPEEVYLDQLVSSYADQRIKYFKNEENKGIPASRNRLIDLAKGAYLAVMDHDDVMLPERLKKQVAYLDEHPEVGVVGGAACLIPSGRIRRNPTDDHDIKLAMMHVPAMMHPASMIRASVLKKTQIRYEGQFSPAEDYGLFARLIPYTQFHNLEDIVLKYRLHATNTSRLQRGKMTSGALAVQAFVSVENPMLYSEFLKSAEHRKRIRLFGKIPFLLMLSRGDLTRVKLFDIIPLCTIKNTIKMRF